MTKPTRALPKLALVTALALVPATASAWEPQTTQAGLAEQAALVSRLHKRLVTLGFAGGLFEPLTIPPADAPALTTALKTLSPTHGAVPDGRGRQVALAWLSAGAALADTPASQGANHFFDPATGAGWRAPGTGLTGKIRELSGRAALPDQGVPAPDWAVSPQNPFNLEQFHKQYAKAVSAATPGERSRYMAAALVAAGAMLHTLGDLGAPARVRGDAAAQLDPLGAGPDDRGSRMERIAALVYGRLGVPAPSRTITRPHLRDYFSSKDGGGLADLIARSYFSPHTLPEPTRVSEDAKPRLVRPQPQLPARLNLMAANRDDGTTLHTAGGTCLARYRVERGLLTFAIDDDCMLEQLAVILPEVAAYEAGLLDFLLRGELAITVSDQITVSGAGLGSGTVEILVEDARGVRTSVGNVQVAAQSAPPAPVPAATPAQPIALAPAPASTVPVAGEPSTPSGPPAVQLAQVPTPASGSRIVAVYRGTDAAGEQVVAVGAAAMTR